MSKKIVHVCLCGPVTDGFSYQENLLTKYHRRLGYEVSIITSQWIWGEDGRLKKDERNRYRNEHDILVVRLAIKRDKNVEAKFKRYEGVYRTIEEENPDILFIHGCQFLDLRILKRYIKRHPAVRTFIDNHADFSNSGTNFFSKYFLHRGIWRAVAKAAAPYVEKFYGVMPARVDFLTKMYGIPKEKVELLVMGADDEKAETAEKEKLGEKVREKYGIAKEDFLLVTGGKIDYAKRQTIYLMEAVKEVTDKRIKLLVFGSVEEELQKQVEELQDGERVIYAGWISSEDSYAYFKAANVVCFPGRHSVFWEQAAGQGLPMIVKYWEGTTHVDMGGNVRFLYKDSKEEIKQVLEEITCNDGEIYKKMKETALKDGKREFAYSEIAKRALRTE